MRYFHQTPDYWWDNCTFTDWADMWQRELRRAPPAEAFLADYFEYEDPTAGDNAEVGLIEETLPEFEE